MKYLALSFAILVLFIASSPESGAEGISYLAKSGIIKRADPDAQDLLRWYLNSADTYNLQECLEYGNRNRKAKESRAFCKAYFKSSYGLTDTSALFVYQTAAELKYPAELRNVLLNYLRNGARYDIDGCNQAWAERISGKRKDNDKPIRKIEIHQLSEEMCEKLFRP